jgi:nicotinamide-nucleotide amidase
MSLRIETLAIGDEILTGKISDTNSTFVANAFFAAGFRLTATSVVLDDLTEMKRALLEASTRADIVVVFGGLGPTSDDKTAECVASLLNCKLAIHEPSRVKMERYYESRKLTVTSHALKQVLYPETAVPLPNLNGMAPGFRCQLGKATFFFHPGVPSEMRKMFTESVVPYVKERAGVVGEIVAQTWRCLGIGESDVQGRMDAVEAELPKSAWLGYRTKFPENHLTLYANKDQEEGERNKIALRIGQILAPWSYSDENRELEEIISTELSKRHWTIAFAESCTGGMTVQRMTRLPGASAIVWGGTVVYQIPAKQSLLNVNLPTKEDSVSERCSRELAERMLSLSGCDVAASITGWLGPDGGTEQDRVGTLYTHVVGKPETGIRAAARIVQGVRSREENQWAASTYLLNEIRKAFSSLRPPKG